jgi:hypothetical protein
MVKYRELMIMMLNACHVCRRIEKVTHERGDRLQVGFQLLSASIAVIDMFMIVLMK